MVERQDRLQKLSALRAERQAAEEREEAMRQKLKNLFESNPEREFSDIDILNELELGVGSMLGRKILWNLVDSGVAEFKINRSFQLRPQDPTA